MFGHTGWSWGKGAEALNKQWLSAVGCSPLPLPTLQASSPQDLRLFYEKNKTLVPT